MATYKAEFLAHHYAGRLRPRSAYAFGWIDRWARLASHAPRAVDLVARQPLLGAMAKATMGMASERTIPTFAPTTFQRWFARRPAQQSSGPPVLLWPDTFDNHFHPHVARAAVEVLEAAGHRVVVPRESLCCGRPLYDFGMLGLARRRLRKVLDVLRAEIEAGTPVVVLEPACASVFRDELVNLFPRDEDAERLSRQTWLLSEYLVRKAARISPPRLSGSAIVHGHCHHKAIMKMADEEEVLRRTGIEFETLDSGCCGMAGAFGFERDKAALSIAIGERVLLPAVRAAAPDTSIVADGYSCREQIAQTTDRRAIHVAELLRSGLHA
jgi:Fe-S oxidoreductase